MLQENIKVQRYQTDYGILSITNRRGYFYACRTVNQKKRQIYLGKIIPDIYVLNEVAKDIFSHDDDWYRNHPPKADYGFNKRCSFSETSANFNSDLHPFILQSQTVDSPRFFPELSGVYCIRASSKDTWIVLYIGSSDNLRRRWQSHHRQDAVDFLQGSGIHLEYRYLVETEYFTFNTSLYHLERQLISQLKPRWNKTPVLDVIGMMQ